METQVTRVAPQPPIVPQERANDNKLTPAELQRYSRHLTLPEVGVAGQEKLKGAKVLSIGAGGLGSPIGLYLAAAGVGTIGVVDFDKVDVTNLQRQIAHTTKEIGRPKVDSIREKMLAMNPHVNVVTHETKLTRDNALELFGQYDIIIDGSDNFETRYLVNDAAFFAGKPLVYGSIFRFEGQISTFNPHAGGSCYRCLYANPPPAALVPNCAEAGVLGVLPGAVGLIMATEAIKLILGVGQPLVNRLMLYDSLRMTFKEVRLRKNPNCELCGDHPTQKGLLDDYEWFCGVHPTQTAVPAQANGGSLEVSAPELKTVLDSGKPVTLLDVREPHEWEIAHIDGARLTPLSQFDSFVPQLKKDDDIYLYCYKGKRSMTALNKLKEAGFKNLHSLAGGIDKWAVDVEPKMPRY